MAETFGPVVSKVLSISEVNNDNEPSMTISDKDNEELKILENINGMFKNILYTLCNVRDYVQQVAHRAPLHAEQCRV